MLSKFYEQILYVGVFFLAAAAFMSEGTFLSFIIVYVTMIRSLLEESFRSECVLSVAALNGLISFFVYKAIDKLSLTSLIDAQNFSPGPKPDGILFDS